MYDIELFKIEHKLEVNNFKTSAHLTNLHALATLVQTLIIMEPKSYPNQPEMGVGIKNYQFEYLDDVTINEIKYKILDQLDKFLPNTIIEDVIVQKLKSRNDLKNTLGIMITLADPIQGANDFVLTFTQEIKSSKIFSEIVI